MKKYITNIKLALNKSYIYNLNVPEFIRKSWKYVLLFFLISIPIFSQLGTLPLRTWDESRLAINAYEMFHNKSFFVLHFNGEPDMWNTKPPLMIWLQVLSMKVFGINEFAVRFPSALAAVFTSVVLLVFFLKYFKNFCLGFSCVLVLITSQGYVYEHCTRTGDFDALLIFFTTMSLLSFFAFTETLKQKYLYIFFISLTLGVLTKSVVPLMFLPALLIYVSIRRQWSMFLKNRHFYIAFFGFIFIVFGYYVLRETQNPGYFSAVYENELVGRYTDEGSTGGTFHYYFKHLMDSRYKDWIWVSICGILLGLFSKDVKIRRITLFSFISVLSFLLIISFSKTKLYWYDTPVFPFLSILTTVCILFIYNFLKNIQYFNKNIRYNIVPFVFLFLLFFSPYRKTVTRIATPHEENEQSKSDYSIAYYLRDILRKKISCEKDAVIVQNYFAPNNFYVNLLNEKGFHFSIMDGHKFNLEPNKIAIAFNWEIIEKIETNYEYKLLDEFYDVKKYKILAKR